MRTITIVSSHAGTGKTTVAVNAAKGLERRGYRVIIHGVGQNDNIYNWLGNLPASDEDNIDSGKIVKTSMGVDLFLNESKQFDLGYYDQVHTMVESKEYDYLILDTDNQKQNTEIASALADIIIACSELAPDDEPQQLAELNHLIENSSRLQKRINLIVPCKINTKEWANNSQVLFAIADRVGYENIADIIPACERIHLLPSDHKHVWELKQQNIKQVFDNLVSRLEII